MRYAQIRSLDISNGEGVGVSLFVQGCPFHCKNCFNSETWDFNGGKEWTEDTKSKFMDLIDNRPYIERVSFLGGECLAEQNLDDILSLIQDIRILFPTRTIWLYTGYEWNSLMTKINQPMFPDKDFEHIMYIHKKRQEIIKLCNVVVDGEYIDEQKDLTLKWRGSKNQNCIDVQKSLAQKKMVLYCD